MRAANRRPRESGGPGATARSLPWVPAFAGKTGDFFEIILIDISSLSSSSRKRGPRACPWHEQGATARDLKLWVPACAGTTGDFFDELARHKLPIVVPAKARTQSLPLA